MNDFKTSELLFEAKSLRPTGHATQTVDQHGEPEINYCISQLSSFIPAVLWDCFVIVFSCIL